MLAVMWLLVALVLIQLQSFSRQADVIMNDYSDITAFLDAYSEENVWLEAYIRPSLDAKQSYRESLPRPTSVWQCCLPSGTPRPASRKCPPPRHWQRHGVPTVPHRPGS